MREPSAGNLAARSSNTSRTVPPSTSTSRSPPASSRSVGGILTMLIRGPPGPPGNAQHFLGFSRVAPDAGAELDVVDVLRDRRRVAADGAARVAPQRDLVEGRRQRVEEEQPADERVADAERELQRLACLQRADDARQHAEHAA